MDALPPVWTAALATFEAWLQARGRRPLTIRSYRHDVILFSRWAQTHGLLTPDALTPARLHEYVTALQLQRRHAQATVNRRIISVRAFCRALAEAQLVPAALTDGLRPFRLQPAPAPTIPHAADIRRLTAALPAGSTLSQRRDYAMVQLALQAGLRLGDLAGLHLPDLVLQADPPYLRIQSGKGGLPATVYLNRTARHALYAYLAVRPPSPSRAVFLTRTRGPMAPRTVYDAMRAYLRSRIASPASPHTLRHIFATLLYRKHKDILLVKEALRHRTLDTTIRYTRKTAHEIALAIEALDTNVGRSRPEHLYLHDI